MTRSSDRILSGTPSAMTTPWSMTTMRSAMLPMNPMSCSTNTMVLAVTLETHDDLGELLLRNRVQPRPGLVEEEPIGTARKRASDDQQALLTGGKD